MWKSNCCRWVLQGSAGVQQRVPGHCSSGRGLHGHPRRGPCGAERRAWQLEAGAQKRPPMCEWRGNRQSWPPPQQCWLGSGTRHTEHSVSQPETPGLQLEGTLPRQYFPAQPCSLPLWTHAFTGSSVLWSLRIRALPAPCMLTSPPDPSDLFQLRSPREAFSDTYPTRPLCMYSRH